MIFAGRKKIGPGVSIRVLVVDDSVVMRRLISLALANEEGIEVVGSASDGTIAIERIAQLKPDLVTLDIEMPGVDGIETARSIRKLYPGMYVLMCSTLTERGASATLDALRAGANDYVTKLSSASSQQQSIADLRDALIPKIKQFFQVEQASGSIAKEATPVTRPAITPLPVKRPWQRRRIVVIGVSTGGPNALAVVMPMFPKNFSLPILIVQHMPPMFTRLLAERLAANSQIGVEEAKEGSVLEPGKALVAPGDYHMRIRRTGTGFVTSLDQGEKEHSCRPSVDVMFRSVAETFQGGVVATILTGMGSDGVEGARKLRDLGAYVIAQDEASSVVWGMPGSVVQSGLADVVVDLNCVTPEILKQV